MGKKKRGHFCKACGRYLANERFSGKGHRQHICKDCKRKGKKTHQPSTSKYDREEHFLTKAIRNCLILYTKRSCFFLFEYQEERFITRDDLESEIFVYQKNADQKFLLDESLPTNKVFLDVLFKKYVETMESENIVDYNDISENDFVEISKKRKQHLEVIASLKNVE